MSKKSHRFVNAPNTELLATQQLLREAYGTPDLDAIGMAFCASGWEPLLIPEYLAKNLIKKY